MLLLLRVERTFIDNHKATKETNIMFDNILSTEFKKTFHKTKNFPGLYTIANCYSISERDTWLDVPFNMKCLMHSFRRAQFVAINHHEITMLSTITRVKEAQIRFPLFSFPEAINPHKIAIMSFRMQRSFLRTKHLSTIYLADKHVRE